MFFLEFLCFLYDPENVGHLISGSSAFSKLSLNIWKLSVHIVLRHNLEDFEHNFTSMGDECNCPEVWTFFRTTLLGNWNEDWPLPVLWNNVPYDSAESLTFLVGLGCCNKIHRLSGFYNRFFFLIAFFFPSGLWNSRKTPTSVSLTMLKPFTVWIITNCG